MACAVANTDEQTEVADDSDCWIESGSRSSRCRDQDVEANEEYRDHHSPGPEADSSPALPAINSRLEIDGYVIERVLSRGGMGTVYLARQLSLNRHVALKVMSEKWASDPVFVARFTREAFAAAQLEHPNIVQIHDIGDANGNRFFSMEYVRGHSLAGLVKAQGKLDPETAVGYVLQAARGLKHAHDRGMIHRDVKPDNLLLNDQGVVKVADLGLVKTEFKDDWQACQISSPAAQSSDSGTAAEPRNHDLTGVRIALGTPAYMSPEQCRDAAAVDHRADIYSLGCTLYVLVTGRPPFDGNTAVELMSKHAYDALVPPEEIVTRVPRSISAIIQRMMAKHPDDRYQSMDEVIHTLECWLGVHTAGNFSPSDDQIARLEEYVAQFNNCVPALVRKKLINGFFGTVALVSVMLAFFGQLALSFGVLGLALQASLAYFVLHGVETRNHLFQCVRRFVAGLGWSDIAVGIAGVALFGILLSLFNVFWIWAGFGLFGMVLAIGLSVCVDRSVQARRELAITGCQRMMRRLRQQGSDEQSIRLFVAKFAGANWEEFFEDLFGYQAKMTARAVLSRGGSAGTREEFATWREPIIAWLDGIERARKVLREQNLLATVERAKLLAAGASVHSAERQANAAAAEMVQIADRLRHADTAPARPGHATRHDTAVSIQALFRAAEAPRQTPPLELNDPVSRVARLFVGEHIRAVAAAGLIAACALWMYQQDGRPLAIQGVNPAMTGWVDSINVGLAGLLLIGSLLFRGNLMSAFALLGAAVAAVGHHFGILAVEPIRSDHVALMVGMLLTLIGFRFAKQPHRFGNFPAG